MGYLLTFDIGTTSVKTCVFDESLHMLGHANDEYLLVTERQGFVELPPETYWEAVCHGARTAATKAGIDPADILTVSVTTQGETLIPIGFDGKALRNAIVWLDERADAQGKRLSALFPPEVFYRETGLPELSGYTPVAKLLWIKENEPDVYAATEKFLLLEDYILYRLTGAFVTEKSLVCSTGWYHFASDGYWTEMLAAAGLDEAKLPALYECGTVVPAGLTADAKAAMGLSGAVRVVTGAMDQTAGAVGAGNLAPGIVTETTGTALCIVATLSKPDLSHPARVTVYRHIRPGSYLMIPICMTAGMFLKWFKDGFCECETERAKLEGRSVYALFDEMVAATAPGAGGLVALPYLSGTLQPHNNPQARGVFFGAGLETKKPEFLRAIFESVAYMLRENLELVAEVNHLTIDEIRSLGGGSKSDVWRQIKADATGLPIGIPEETECGSLGAAILAAVAVGLYESPEQAAEQANRIVSRTLPQPANKAVYDAGYATYRALYDRVEPLFSTR